MGFVDSGRSSVADDGLFSAYEQSGQEEEGRSSEQSRETLVKDIRAPTPISMLSANSDPKLVMKGVTHGACYYLVKPIRIEELRNIWQHVIRNKPRVIWTIELHNKFVAAVSHLGIEKAVPKIILEMMNVEGLTRESVASHLQRVENLQAIMSKLRLLTLLEAGLPSWVIFLQSYPGSTGFLLGDLDCGRIFLHRGRRRFGDLPAASVVLFQCSLECWYD